MTPVACMAWMLSEIRSGLSVQFASGALCIRASLSIEPVHPGSYNKTFELHLFFFSICVLSLHSLDKFFLGTLSHNYKKRARNYEKNCEIK